MTESAGPNFGRRLAGGALINALGTAGRVLHPLHLVVITRLYGPSAVGVYVVLNVFLEMAKTTTVSGLADATMVYLSKNPHDRQYQARILGSALWTALAISAVIVVGGWLGGIELLGASLPDRPQIRPALYQLIWVVPFSLLPQIALAATQAQLLMRWSTAVNGFLYPGLLIVTAVGFHRVRPDVTGLVWSLATSVVLTGFAALWILLKFYSAAELRAMMARPQWHGPTLKFAIPQNLNMTFTVFTTNVDILMLAAYGVSDARIAFYSIGASIIRNLRQVRIALTRAYAPLVVRLHAAGDHRGLAESYSMISRWSMSIGFPIALALVAVHEDVLRLFDESFGQDTTFMLVLLIFPIASMVFGAAATLLVMTGHTRLNLFNSLMSAALNIGLNAWLIPKYGLVGAAAATSVTLVVTATVINLQVFSLERVHLIGRRIYRPLLAVGPAAAALLFARLQGYNDATPGRLATAAVVVVLFYLTYAAIGFDPEDRQVLGRQRPASEPSTPTGD